jgi:3-isopropylmalate dehydrogenase
MKSVSIPRRALAAALALSLALPLTTVSAQSDKPIRLIVPLTTGSTVDTVARAMSAELAKATGHAVFVENLVGAGGVTGTTTLVRAPKDGLTLGMVSSNHVINPSIYKSIPFDSIKDITPITVIGTVPLVLVVHPDVPAKNLKELIALAKAKPKTLNYGSAGNGSVLHLAGELLSIEAGIEMQHVPYKGTGPLTTDLIGGQVQLGLISVTAAAPHVKAGKLRALGVSTPKRSAALPEVPSLAEEGLPNYSFDAWIALIGPAGLPKVLAQSVRVLEALRSPDFQFEATEAPIGATAYRQLGHPLPEATLRLARDADAVLFGAVGDARLDHLERSLRPEQAILGLRTELGLYASLRQIRVEPALADLSPLKADLVAGLDLLVVLELSGDVYTGQPRGQRAAPDGSFAGEREGFDTMRYAESEVRRVARVAFEAARQRGRRVCSVDKANVLETSQLWRRVVSEVATDYADVALSHMYADNAAMHLVTRPKTFDVLLTANLFGDILSDAASVLTGSIGLPASAMFGEASGRATALYEPGHGSAFDIASKDHANPIASIRSAALMLRYSLRRADLADRVERAIDAVLKHGLRTADIASSAKGPGGKRVGTCAMGDAIVAALHETH